MNPYRIALGLIAKRFLWDLTPSSWLSRKYLSELKNTRSGEKAVILCNGPSLRDVDFSLLENTFTIGLNKINLLFDGNDFRPSCIVAVNPHVIQQNANFYATTDIPNFLEQGAARKFLAQGHSSTLLHTAHFPSFSKDISMSIFEGYTVTYVAMQLAFHLGFDAVSLVGCDHSFSVSGNPNETQKAEGDDISHFHKDYFSGGQLWNLPDLLQSEMYYKLASESYQQSGRTLVNSTVGGKLDVLPRLSLTDFLQNN